MDSCFLWLTLHLKTDCICLFFYIIFFKECSLLEEPFFNRLKLYELASPYRRQLTRP